MFLLFLLFLKIKRYIEVPNAMFGQRPILDGYRGDQSAQNSGSPLFGRFANTIYFLIQYQFISDTGYVK
jgi:hypothetical protein